MEEIYPLVEDRKRAAAEAAVAEIQSGMMVGLGTGSTASYAIVALASRVRQGLSVRAVATSHMTAQAAERAGILLCDLSEIAEIDLCIDGIDQIDPQFRAIKGAGGAMLREKIVAQAARRMIAIADDSKTTDRLGARPLPLEVLPAARAFVEHQAKLLGGAPVLRHDTEGAPFLTDQGNLVVDCDFGKLHDPAFLARQLDEIPGLLGHGLFLLEIDTLYLGMRHGVTRSDRPIGAA